MDLPTLGTALGSLAAVIALIVGLSHLARRTGRLPAAGSRRLEVQEALPLGSRRRLLLLRCDGHAVLALTGGGQDALLLLPREPR
ncbi:MAG: flagellar biosynthetic protein FliO [Acetobacteraceae bacterium]|nr:flagellar biosynthetic protein FliO [Acetobacteraceae bacterium]